MPTSTRFVVSIHALVLLADAEGAPLRSEDIAAELGKNAAVVRALLSRLAAAGITTSLLGSGGGALLARPSDRIRLIDVYLAVEDREIFTFHRSPAAGRHPIGRHFVASLEGPLRTARLAMEKELEGVTIQDIRDDIHRRDT